MQPDARLFLMVALAVLALTVHPPALGQAARSSTGNAQAMQQLQQLAAERTQLLAENAKLKSDLDAARKERDAFKKKQESVERAQKSTDVAVARATAKSDSLSQELERERTKMTEIVAKFRELAVQLRTVEGERSTFRTSLSQRDVELKQCIDRNLSLYALNGEVLNRLEHRGGFSAGSALEPFTRLKRIELENLIDGYQTRADEQRPPSAALQAPPSR